MDLFVSTARRLSLAGLVLGVLPLSAAAQELGALTADTITFDALATGARPTQVFGELGLGPVGVSGVKPGLGTLNAALVFDSSAPTGGDPDLGSPNQSFGGPGVGLAGQSGSPFQNATALGKVLVVADTITDSNGDGLVDNPGDAEVQGARLELDFTGIGPVYVDSLKVIDIQNVSGSSSVRLFDMAGQSIGTVTIAQTGDNGVATVALGNGPVGRLELRVEGSGGFDEVAFRLWADCNGNGILDEIELAGGGADCDANGVLDACDPDCDADGLPDSCETDCNTNGVPDDCEGSASVVRNGSGANALGFTEVTPPIVGQDWNVSVDLGGGVASIVVISLAGPLPGVTLNGAVQGELLARPPFLIKTGFGAQAIPIPTGCEMIGLPFTTQAGVFAPGQVTLYNAIDITLGTF